MPDKKQSKKTFRVYFDTGEKDKNKSPVISRKEVTAVDEAAALKSVKGSTVAFEVSTGKGKPAPSSADEGGSFSPAGSAGGGKGASK